MNLNIPVQGIVSWLSGIWIFGLLGVLAFLAYSYKKQLFIFKQWPIILWIRQQRENGEFRKVFDLGRPVTSKDGKIIKIERKTGKPSIDWIKYQNLSVGNVLECAQVAPDQYIPLQAVAVKPIKKDEDGNISFAQVYLNPLVSEADRIGVITAIQNSQEKYVQPSWIQRNMLWVQIALLIGTIAIIGYLMKDPASTYLTGSNVNKEAASIFAKAVQNFTKVTGVVYPTPPPG